MTGTWFSKGCWQEEQSTRGVAGGLGIEEFCSESEGRDSGKRESPVIEGMGQ